LRDESAVVVVEVAAAESAARARSVLIESEPTL